MSSDIVTCPQCRINLQNTPELAGQVVRCPQCQTSLQMPPAATATPASSPLPNAGQPLTVPDLPTPIQPTPGKIGIDTSAKPSSARSVVEERVRRKSNPIPVIITVVIALLLVVAGIVGFLMDRAADNRTRIKKQMIGNWELAAGQTQLDRWEFAFHENGHFQMLLEANDAAELNEGNWAVTSVRGNTATVRIEWPDDAPETMKVRFAGGQMHVELPSVGNFTFRAAIAPPNSTRRDRM